MTAICFLWANKRSVAENKLVVVYTKQNFNLSATARRLGISRWTLHRYLLESPMLKRRFDEAKHRRCHQIIRAFGT